MKFSKLLPFGLVTILFYSCTSNQKKNEDKGLINDTDSIGSTHPRIAFDSAIKTIDSSMGISWDRNDKLILIPTFRELYEHSSSYLSDDIRYLSDSNITYRQAAICLYAMQNLQIEDYLKVCKIFLDLFNKHKISENLLSSAIMPNFLEHKNIVNNYNNPHVVEFLKTVRDNEQVSSELKDNIQNILGGR
jgi:hypothetical protein